jgi:glycogen phosphorylase
VRLLGNIDHQGALESAARDDSFLAPLNGVLRAWRAISPPRAPGTGASTAPPTKISRWRISPRNLVTECLSIFAGGLVVLAGDHLKASSDLALPDHFHVLLQGISLSTDLLNFIGNFKDKTSRRFS